MGLRDCQTWAFLVHTDLGYCNYSVLLVASFKYFLFCLSCFVCVCASVSVCVAVFFCSPVCVCGCGSSASAHLRVMQRSCVRASSQVNWGTPEDRVFKEGCMNFLSTNGSPLCGRPLWESTPGVLSAPLPLQALVESSSAISALAAGPGMPVASFHVSPSSEFGPRAWGSFGCVSCRAPSKIDFATS